MKHVWKKSLVILLTLVLLGTAVIQPFAGTIEPAGAAQDLLSAASDETAETAEDSGSDASEDSNEAAEPNSDTPEDTAETEDHTSKEEDLDYRNAFGANAAEKAATVGLLRGGFSYGNPETDGIEIPFFYTKADGTQSGRYVYYFTTPAGAHVYRVYGTMNGQTGFWTAQNASGDLDETLAELRTLAEDLTLFGRTEGGEAGPDDTYIRTVETAAVTGVGPFDADDAPGHDSSANNDIVRSFDTITYNLKLTMAVNDGEHGSETAKKHYSFKGGKIYLTATLPAELEGLAKWDTDSIPWASDLAVSADGLTVSFYYQMSTAETTIPGNQTLSIPLNVYGAANGTEIQPVFTTWMEGNNENPAHISGEAKQFKLDKVYVSAAPSYDLVLSNNAYAPGALTTTDEFTGTDLTGRIYGYGLRLQLHNTENSNNLKGVEFPQGEITFDIDVLVTEELLDGSGVKNNVTNTLMPRLWDYQHSYATSSLSRYGMKYGRDMFQGVSPHAYTGATITPYSYLASDTELNRLRSIYDSGDWDFEEGYLTTNSSGETVMRYSITVDNYAFSDYFPICTVDRYSYYVNGTHAASYAGNIGVFSSLNFQLFIPMPDEAVSASYSVNVVDANFHATGLSGQETTTQTVTSNDSSTRSHEMRIYGTYSKQIVFYSSNGTGGVGSRLSSSSHAGDAAAYAGETVWLWSYINASVVGDLPDLTVDHLTVFDADAFTPTGNIRAYNTPSTYTYLWGALPSGGNWTSDTAMQAAEVEDLIWYASLADLQATGAACVGVLGESPKGFTFADPNASASGRGYYVELDVRTDAATGTVYQATNRGYIWRDQLDRTVYTRTNPTADYTAVLPDAKIYAAGNGSYRKTQYDADTGAIVSGTPVGTPNYGNCLLIVGAELGVSKTVLQTASGAPKSIYNLAYNENIVQYRLSPSIKTSEFASTTIFTTVTVTDTLPKGLTYVAGSASYGGVVGSDGLIAEGSGTTFEPQITVNSNGTTTLKWIIDNVEVGGKGIPPIDFQAAIDQNSPNNQQYTNTVNVTCPLTAAGASDTYGIQVVNLADHKLYKTANQAMTEVGGDVSFTISYINNEEISMNDITLYDLLPYNGDYRYTSYNGTYWLKSVSVSALSGAYSGQVYYTTNTGLQGATSELELKDLADALPESAWTLLSDPTNIPRAVGETIVAIRVKGQVDGKSQISAVVTMGTEDNLPGDIYGNAANLIDGSWGNVLITPAVKEIVLTRNVSGLVWFDRNNDGERQEGERLISGMTVSLWKLDTGTGAYVPATDLFGNAIPNVITGADGSYLFENLVSGTYQVRIYGIDYDSYYITHKEAAGAPDYANSKAEETPATDANGDYAVIKDIYMPAADEIYVLEYALPYQDAGISTIGRVSVTKQLLDENGDPLDGRGLTFYAGLFQILSDDTEVLIDKGSFTWNEALNVYNVYTFSGIEPGNYRIYELDADGEIVSDFYAYLYSVDPDDGKITLTPEDPAAEVTITNVRKFGYFTPTARKQANDFVLKADAFTFELAEDLEFTKILQTKYNAADGSIVFDTLKLTEEGTFVYYIRERIPVYGVNYISYDETVYKLTLTVAADETTLVGMPEYEVVKSGAGTDEVVFTNQYLANGEVLFTAVKELENRTIEENQFSFVLYDVTNSKVLQTVQNDALGNIRFDPVQYTQADIGKTYQYKVYEVDSAKPGYTYDDAVYNIFVTIKDGGEGDLITEISTTLAGDPADDILFRNRYNASGRLVLNAEKVLSGRVLEEGQFTFRLQQIGGQAYTATNAADGTVTFPALAYTEADIGKTFVYTVSEVSHANPGYTYDDRVYTVVVEIHDNGDGTLSPEIVSLTTGIESASEIVFENTYEAYGELVLGGTKSLSGRLLEEGQFSFALKDSSGKVIETVCNALDGAFSFDALSYTQDDIGKTFYYTVEEVYAGADGYTYDRTIYTVHVLIVDNGDGTLTCQVSLTADDNAAKAIEFQNAYNAYGKITLEGMKALSGRVLEDGQFYFELYNETGELLETVQNDETGSFAFAALEYNELDAAKTFVYTVAERNDGAPGYTYDTCIYTITISVTDNGDGTLDVQIVSIEAEGREEAEETETSESLQFENRYDAYGEITLEGLKTLEGRTLEDGQFFFELRDEDGELLQTVQHDEEGNFSITLEYNELDAAQYFTYTVSERIDGADGYIYDERIYMVVISVSDNGDGTMTAELVSITEDGEEVEGIQFDNWYLANGEFLPMAKKTLAGQRLKDGQFTFALYNAEGVLLQETRNNGNGAVYFDPIAYTQADVGETFAYTIREVYDEADTGYIYDSSIYTVQVLVSDNGDGTLSSSVVSLSKDETAAEAAVFANTYIQPETPNTGDNGSLFAPAFGGTAAILLLLFTGKRRKQPESC